MKLRDLDSTLAAANPVRRAAVARLTLPAIEAEIIARPQHRPATSPQSPRGRRRRRPAAVLAVGVAALALVAILALSLGGAGKDPDFAQAAVRVAEENPRLLVTAPGWSVTSAGQFEPDSGEIRFGNGSHDLAINWYPAALYGEYLDDRAEISEQEVGKLLGLTATTVEYSGDDHATMLSPQGSVFLEIRGGAGGRAAYEEVLDSLREVDVNTWLEAMPPTVVRPVERGEEVTRLLRGVPLPPGFNQAALEGEDAVLDDYQFAVTIADEVSCGWVQSWLAATSAGDAAAARSAADAMGTYPRWPMMKTLEDGGGWAGNIKMAAHELKSGDVRRGPSGYSVEPDGSGYAMGPSWAMHLNCASAYWKRPLTPAEKAEFNR